MKLIKLKSIVVPLMIMITLSFAFVTYKVNAKIHIDDKSYKVNKQVMPWMPKGIDIDLQGNIYINFAGGINVYDASGVFKYAIKVKTYGTYEMKIDNDDLLNVALVRERIINVYNKVGNIIQEKADNDNMAYNEYHKSNRIKSDFQGNEYKLSNIFGYTKVVKINPDGLKNTIYRIPPLAWILKLIVPVFLIFFMVIVLLILIASKKNTKIS